MVSEECIKCKRDPTYTNRGYIEVIIKFNDIEKDVRRFMFCKGCIGKIRLMSHADILKEIIGVKND